MPALGRRLAEAARLGFERAIVPEGSGKEVAAAGLRVIEVASIDEALKAAFGTPSGKVVGLEKRRREHGAEGASAAPH